MVPIESAAANGLRSLSWPASIAVFLHRLREATPTTTASDDEIESEVLRAGNDLVTLAGLYPSLVAAATRHERAKQLHDIVAPFLVEEVATVSGLSHDEARTTIQAALRS